MNIEYVRGLRDYFKEVRPENVNQRMGTLRVRTSIPTSEVTACGCLGVHSAVFSDENFIDTTLGQKIFHFGEGWQSNSNNGLHTDTLKAAYYRCGGTRENFHPYDEMDWEVPVLDVLDEVIRMHSE